MAKLSIVAGTTSKQLLLFIQDSSSTTGAGRSGLAFNTTGLSATYAFAGALPVTITFATLTATTAAFSSGGFIEMNASIMTGWYRFDAPNAMLAGAGTSGQVGLHLFGAASMAPLPVEIELTGWNNQLAFANQTIAAVVGTVAASVTAMSANISGNQTVAQVAGVVLANASVTAMSAGIMGNQTIAAVVGTVAASVTAMSANISGNQTVAAVAASIGVSIGPVTVAALVANIMGSQTIAAVVGTVPASVVAMSANISGNQTVAAVAASIGVSIGNVTVGAMIANILGSQSIAAVAGPVSVGTLAANIMGNQTIAVVAGSVGAVGVVVPANIVQVNSIAVHGAGTSVSPWGP